MGSYHRGSLLVMCAASMLAAAAPALASVAEKPGHRQHPGTNPKLIPVDRQRRRHSNSGSLSKLLASGRRRGRI